jgi:hypothetical protein
MYFMLLLYAYLKLIVPCLNCFQEHLEDKHLRQILLESEMSSSYAQLDPDSSSGQGAASSK